MKDPTDDQYRAAARRLYYPPAEPDLQNSVSLFAAVHPLRGEGAFVEMTVWVPLAEAAKEADEEHPTKAAAR